MNMKKVNKAVRQAQSFGTFRTPKAVSTVCPYKRKHNK